MDEAENCSRMTLIYKGNIIAMGTPKEMKTKFMANDIVQISVPEPEVWMERLKTEPLVKEAALFGSFIHVVVQDAKEAVPVLKGLIEKDKVEGFTVNRIEPSLEDVFVSLIEEYDAGNNKNEHQKS